MPAGRPAGSVSKNKQALLLLLQKQYPDYHPVVELARIGNDPETDPSLAVQCHKEVAQYVTPKLKAVEVETVNHQPVRVEIVQYGKNTEQPGKS